MDQKESWHTNSISIKELKVCAFISHVLSKLLYLSSSISSKIFYCNPMTCLMQHFYVYCSVWLCFPPSCTDKHTSGTQIDIHVNINPWGPRISFSTSERGPDTLLWQTEGRINKHYTDAKQWQEVEWAKREVKMILQVWREKKRDTSSKNKNGGKSNDER